MDHILVELVIEQRVRVLLPGHRLDRQHTLLPDFLPRTHPFK